MKIGYQCPWAYAASAEKRGVNFEESGAETEKRKTKRRKSSDYEFIKLVENGSFWKDIDFHQAKSWLQKYQQEKNVDANELLDNSSVLSMTDEFSTLQQLLVACTEKRFPEDICQIKVEDIPTNHHATIPILSALLFEYGENALSLLAGFTNNFDALSYEKLVKDVAFGSALNFIASKNSNVLVDSLKYLLAKIGSNFSKNRIANYFADTVHSILCGLQDADKIAGLSESIVSSDDSLIQKLPQARPGISPQVIAIHKEVIGIIQTTLVNAHLSTDSLNEQLYENENFWNGLHQKAEKYHKRKRASVCNNPPFYAASKMDSIRLLKNQMDPDSSEDQEKYDEVTPVNFLTAEIDLQGRDLSSVVSKLKETSSVKIENYDPSFFPSYTKLICLKYADKAEKFAKQRNQKFLESLCKPTDEKDGTCVLYQCCLTDIQKSKNLWKNIVEEDQVSILSRIEKDNDLFSRDLLMLEALCDRSTNLSAGLLNQPTHLFSCALSMLKASQLIDRKYGKWLIIDLLEKLQENSGGSFMVPPHVATNLALLRQAHLALLDVSVEVDGEGSEIPYRILIQDELQNSELSKSPEMVEWLLGLD